MHFALEILVIIGRRKMSRLKLFYLLGSTLILLQTIGCGKYTTVKVCIVFIASLDVCRRKHGDNTIALASFRSLCT